MKRFYYISDNLDDLEQIEHDLESGGIARPQIYLLSNDDVGLDNHDVNRVASFLKTDVIHSGARTCCGCCYFVGGAPLRYCVAGRLGALCFSGYHWFWILHMGGRLYWNAGTECALHAI